MPVIEVTHPLVRHKVGLLRAASLSTKSFREITAELGRLLAYEATADFPLEPAIVEGWAGPVQVERISGKKVTLVPILREIIAPDLSDRFMEPAAADCPETTAAYGFRCDSSFYMIRAATQHDGSARC